MSKNMEDHRGSEFLIVEAIKSICAVIKNVAQQYGKQKVSCYEWTHRLLMDIGNIGRKQFRQDVCPTFVIKNSRYKIGEPEWLYDLVWYESGGNGNRRYVKRINLVLESEWSHYTSEVQKDFEKLLIAKAKLKVLIAEDWQEDDSVMNMVEREIQNFIQRNEDEYYLIALFKGSDLAFQIYANNDLAIDGVESHLFNK